MAIGQGRIWFPDGRAYIVPLLERPKHGVELHALGIRPHAWVVTDMRPSGDDDLSYEVWVKAAPSPLAL